MVKVMYQPMYFTGYGEAEEQSNEAYLEILVMKQTALPEYYKLEMENSRQDLQRGLMMQDISSFKGFHCRVNKPL